MRKVMSMMLMASLLFSLSGCNPPEEQKEQEPDENITQEQTAQADSFAQWEDNTVDFTPQIPLYEINENLDNVLYTNIIEGPDEAKEYLAQYGFVVTDGWYDEYFSLYENNRYEYIPSFITTDSVLHTYHLYFNFLLKSLEENELYDLAYELSKSMQGSFIDAV